MLPDSEPQPARTIGRYALFAEIASGGMASIHIGRLLGPVGFARTVAIKRLHPQFARDPEFVTMFLDEARLAARIRHPNVAPTLDVVATEGELFLVMEYFQGESLAQLVRALQKAEKPIPQDIVRTIMSGILHGLHAAHEATNEQGEPLGIVHRDISPQNIHVGTDGVARLLDFGIAKAIGRSHVTRDRHVKGKLSYMAPEQLQEGEVDRRVDIYAAAVVLWELLTGRRLFDAETDETKLVRVLTTVVARPSSVLPSISASLDRLVLRGMNRNPKLRFSTAREMALALEASGKMATPSVVGAWVESVAKEALDDRAAHVAAVEQCKDLPVEVTSSRVPRISGQLGGDDLPTVTAPATDGTFVEDGSVELVPEKSGIGTTDHGPDTSRSAPFTPQRRSRAPAIAALVFVFAVALLALAKSPLVSNDKVRVSAVTWTALRTFSLVPAVAQGLGVAAGRGSFSEGGSGEPKSTDAGPLPSQPESSAKIPTGSQPPHAARAKYKPSDCYPPFTLDASGIRHYKRHCL